jgi:hypothetical protein
MSVLELWKKVGRMWNIWLLGIALLWSLGFLVTIVMNAKRVLATYVRT